MSLVVVIVRNPVGIYFTKLSSPRYGPKLVLEPMLRQRIVGRPDVPLVKSWSGRSATDGTVSMSSSAMDMMTVTVGIVTRLWKDCELLEMIE